MSAPGTERRLGVGPLIAEMGGLWKNHLRTQGTFRKKSLRSNCLAASFLRLTWQGMPVVAQPYCQEYLYAIGVHPPSDCTASGAVPGHWIHSNLVFAESGQCPARPGHPSVLKRCFQSLLVNFALNVTILYSEVADCEASGSTGSAP